MDHVVSERRGAAHSPGGPRRVAITGLGAITSLGESAPETWRQLLAGASGLRRTSGLDPAQHPCLVAGSLAPEAPTPRFLTGKTARTTSRFARLAVEAAGEALVDAGLLGDDLTPDGAAWPGGDWVAGGAVFGTCVGGTYDDLLPAYDTFTARGPGRVPPHLHVMFPHNLAAYAVQARFGLGGPSSTVVTACATGAQAVGDAFHAIRYGRAPLMVCGAVESDIHPFFIAGFAAMRALATDANDDPPAASRPFDASRAGFVLGEGAAVLVLEDLALAQARGARVYAEVLGYGTSNDAYHPIAPLPDGSGAARAIRAALADGGIDPVRVDHVNAHATSTPAGDLAEAEAIRAVFGERAASLPVTAPKGALGHCMGAAGAIEAVITALTIHEGCVPPTLNYRTPDPTVSLDVVHGAPRPLTIDVATTNSFGLGGQNACLALGRVTA